MSSYESARRREAARRAAEERQQAIRTRAGAKLTGDSIVAVVGPCTISGGKPKVMYQNKEYVLRVGEMGGKYILVRGKKIYQ